MDRQVKVVKVPNPGSDEALKEGCTCAVFDNRHGLGAFDAPNGQFWVSGNCPLHGEQTKFWGKEDGS